MDLKSLQVEIRARTIGDIISLAIRLLQHRPVPLLLAWGLYSLAILGLALLLGRYCQLPHGLLAVSLLLLAPGFSSPLLLTAGHLVFSPQVSMCQVIQQTVTRGSAFLVLFLLNRLLSLLGLCVLVIPGFLLWRQGWFLAPIALLEQAPLRATLLRSRRFCFGFHDHALSYGLTLMGVLFYLTAALCSMIYLLIVYVFGLTMESLAELTQYDTFIPWLLVISYALTLPLVSLIWFFVYLDVRIRKEGWDLEISFRTRAAQWKQNHGPVL